MKGSLKKVIKILLIVAVVVVGFVVLYNVIFPQPKIDYCYNLSVEIENNKDLAYIQTNFGLVTAKLDTLDSTGANSDNISDKFEQCDNVLDSYYSSIKLMQTGLLYNDRTKNYNSNANKLKKYTKTLNESLKDTREYLENTYLPYLAEDNLNIVDVLRYNDTFKTKYYNMLNDFDHYMDILVDVYYESARNALEVNEITKLQNKYIAILGNKILHKNISENQIVDATYLFDLTSRDFTVLQMSEIVNIKELTKKVDLNVINDAIVNNNLNETINSQTNKKDYEDFVKIFFNI